MNKSPTLYLSVSYQQILPGFEKYLSPQIFVDIIEKSNPTVIPKEEQDFFGIRFRAMQRRTAGLISSKR